MDLVKGLLTYSIARGLLTYSECILK
jgi:hypothetical protein